MTILVIVLGVLALIVLSSWGKVNAFLAFLLVSVLAGLALGLAPAQVLAAVQKGLGEALGSVVLVLVLGAMLGKLVAGSGAPDLIVGVEDRRFGAAAHAGSAHFADAAARHVAVVVGLHVFEVRLFQHFLGIGHHVSPHFLLVVADAGIEGQHGQAPLVLSGFVERNLAVVVGAGSRRSR